MSIREIPTWQLSDSRAAERVYRQHGLPNLIEGYAAFDDVLTRASPLLAALFVINIVTVTLDATWPTQLVAVIAGATIVLAINAAQQRKAGRRWWSLPQRIGPWYLATFLVVPVVLRALVGDHSWPSIVLHLLIDIAVLAVVTLLATFGVGSMIVWAVRQTRLHALSISEVVIKTLPLLLLTVLFFFFTGETWQLMHNLPNGRFIGSLSVFAIFGSLLLITSIKANTREVTAFESHGELVRHARQLGALGLPETADERLVPEHELPRHVRINVALVLFFSQAVQVFIVFAVVSIVLIGLGVLFVRPATMLAWLGEEPTYLTDVSGSRIRFPDTVTSELIKVALFIGAFSGVQFAVQIASGNSSAHQVLRQAVHSVRAALAVRILRAEIVGVAVDGPSADAHPSDTT